MKKRIVIKIGSNVLTRTDGKLDVTRVSSLVDQVASLRRHDYEIILVNDSSPDNSWNKILEVCSKDSKVKGINLSRNFGQHYAITAGLSESKGEWIVVMDCDLQDRPEEIPNLLTQISMNLEIRTRQH